MELWTLSAALVITDSNVTRSVVYMTCTGPRSKHVCLLQINLGTTVTMTSNGRQTAEGQRQPSQGAGQSDQRAPDQAPPVQPNGAAHQQGQGGGPRVIRITHQTMEPVVMMQMNIDGE